MLLMRWAPQRDATPEIGGAMGWADFFFFASPLSVQFVRPGTVDATPKLELVRFLPERRTR